MALPLIGWGIAGLGTAGGTGLLVQAGVNAKAEKDLQKPLTERLQDPNQRNQFGENGQRILNDASKAAELQKKMEGNRAESLHW